MRDNNILVQHIKPIVRKMGLSFMNWRCLRTSYAKWLKIAGTDVKDAQALMRHFDDKHDSEYLPACHSGVGTQKTRITKKRKKRNKGGGCFASSERKNEKNEIRGGASSAAATGKAMPDRGAHAAAVLKGAGVRIMALDAGVTIGV